jgi:hypothetical protein
VLVGNASGRDHELPLKPFGPSEVSEGDPVTFQVTRTHYGNETVNASTLQDQGWNNLSGYQPLQGAPLVVGYSDLGPQYFSIQPQISPHDRQPDFDTLPSGSVASQRLAA